MGVREFVSAGVLECGSAGVRECGSAGVRECGSAGVRECGSAGVRECGSAGVRECGSAGVRECGSAGVRECGSARLTTMFVWVTGGGGIVVVRAGHEYVGSTSESSSVSRAADVLWINVVHGMRGVGGVLKMGMYLTRGVVRGNENE